ncbi:MAG TPA: hypothetical protein PLP58_12015 [Prosthecobacter sp.]|nr:hypothetical protein [Prosthecobacter sp.]
MGTEALVETRIFTAGIESNFPPPRSPIVEDEFALPLDAHQNDIMIIPQPQPWPNQAKATLSRAAVFTGGWLPLKDSNLEQQSQKAVRCELEAFYRKAFSGKSGSLD